MFEGVATAAPSKPQTLDEVIFDTLVADYPRALKEWDKRTENDPRPYAWSDRAEIYADGIMKSPFGCGHGQALRAAHSDYAPEYPPRQRTPLQERLRAKIAKFVEPTFKNDRPQRADAYARARVDLLEHHILWNATVDAVRADLYGPTMSSDEARAIAAEERYNAGQRRW